MSVTLYQMKAWNQWQAAKALKERQQALKEAVTPILEKQLTAATKQA